MTSSVYATNADALQFSAFGGSGLSPLARIEWSTRRGVDAAGSAGVSHSAEADVYDGKTERNYRFIKYSQWFPSAIFGSAAVGNIFGSPAIPVAFSLKFLRQHVTITKQNISAVSLSAPFDSMLNFSIRLLARIVLVKEASGSSPDKSLAESYFSDEAICGWFSTLIVLLGVRCLLDNHVWSRLRPDYNSEEALEIFRGDCKIILQRYEEYNSKLQNSPFFKSISAWSAYASVETMLSASNLDKASEKHLPSYFAQPIKVRCLIELDVSLIFFCRYLKGF